MPRVGRCAEGVDFAAKAVVAYREVRGGLFSTQGEGVTANIRSPCKRGMLDEDSKPTSRPPCF